MKQLNLTVFVTVLFAGFLLVGSALAAEHGMSGMSHDGMAGMDHGKMNQKQMGDMMADMKPLGHMMVENVKATAMIKDVHEAMKEHGMSETHHVMVRFASANDHPLDKGTVAVRITDPSGKTTEPMMMMGMEGSFGADVTLAARGKYNIEVACKLEDGKKRQYMFPYIVK
jgi:hypothetical protein